MTGLRLHGTDAVPLRHHQTSHCSFVENLHPCPLRSADEFFNDGAAAADRLDTGRAGAEVIDRSDEFDAVALEPSNGLNRVLRERPEITSIGQSAGRLPHVVLKTGCKPIRCVEPHVGRAPAGISAGFGFMRFFKQGNLDAQAAAARLLGGCKRRCETGRSVSDDHQPLKILRHSRQSRFDLKLR